MTDTTDIKALRDRMMQQREAALTGNTPSFEDCEQLVCDVMRALKMSTSQLEEERQRAEALQGQLDYRNEVLTRAIRQREAAEADAEHYRKAWKDKSDEAAALTGDQVQVGKFAGWGLYRADTDSFGNWLKDNPREETDHAIAKNGYVNVRLFTAPQKPVVLPSPYYGDRHCLDKREVIAAIEAAGGSVKDGE